MLFFLVSHPSFRERHGVLPWGRTAQLNTALGRITAMNDTDRKQSALTRNATHGSSAKSNWSATLVAAGLGGFALTNLVANANEPGAVHYPDLQTLAPYNFKIQNDSSTHRK